MGYCGLESGDASGRSRLGLALLDVVMQGRELPWPTIAQKKRSHRSSSPTPRDFGSDELVDLRLYPDDSALTELDALGEAIRFLQPIHVHPRPRNPLVLLELGEAKKTLGHVFLLIESSHVP